MLGDVLIDVIESIDYSESSSTTDHALEDGEEMTDHIDNDPITLKIDGIIIDKNDAKKLKLRDYRQKGKILSFNYVSGIKNVVITSFNTNYSKDIKNGYSFSMSLKQIRLVKAPTIVNVNQYVKQQIKVVANAGRQQLK